MTESHSIPDDREDRFSQVLAEYLEAADSGAAPDDTTWLAGHPELAGELVDFLSAVHEVEHFAAPLRRAVTPTPAGPPLPRVVAEYELLAEIGRGGMGVVYRALQHSLKRLVAVKMIRAGLLASAGDSQRFRAEAEAAAHLDHPGIVPVYEIGEHEGHPFFSMKLMDGGSLAEQLSEYHADPRRAVDVMIAVARALHHAHQRGILHRDLKPSNILLDGEGRPHVADFGLAKWLNTDQTQTQTGLLIGTPVCIAPELVSTGQRSAKRMATTASDVYGLGTILYTLLARRPPFYGLSPLDTLLAVCERDPEPPGRLNSLVDRDLETICLKCLDKDPARRYASAADLADDLERWQAGELILARPVGTAERLLRWCRRNPFLALTTTAAGLLLIATVVSLATGYWLVSDARQVSEGHRSDAQQKAATLRQQLYVSQMNRAFKHAERGEHEELKKILDRYRNEDDLAGFEWRWLDAQVWTKPREAVKFTGHQGIVYCGSFSADGKTVVSCGEDRSIQLWDAETGTPRATLRPRPATAALPVREHTEDENCVAFSPDGRRLVSACEDGSVRLWDLATESWQPLTPAHQGEVLSVSFSRDGRWLATAGVDKVVRVWDVDSPGPASQLTGHTAAVNCAVFSPDGSRIASAGSEGSVLVWDRELGTIAYAIQPGGKAYCVAFSPDGLLLATGDQNRRTQIWNAANGEFVRNFGPAQGNVRWLDFSPDGKRVACCGNDGFIGVWSVAYGELLHYFKGHESAVWSVRFASDGRRLLTASSDKTARVWELPSRTPSTRWNDAPIPAVRRLMFGLHGSLIVISTSDGNILLGDPAERGPLATLPVKMAEGNDPLIVSPNGNELAFACPDGSIQRWLLAEQQALPILEASQPAADESPVKPQWARVAYTADGRLWALRPDGRLLVYNGQQSREYRLPIRGNYPPTLLAPLLDGKSLAIDDPEQASIRVWNVRTEVFDFEFPCAGLVGDISCFSADGKRLAVPHSRNIRLVELPSGAISSELVGHDLNVTSLAFSPDGKTLASASHDGTVRLWHVATGEELAILEDRHGAPVRSVAFSPDGRLLLAGGDPAPGTSDTVTVYDTGPSVISAP